MYVIGAAALAASLLALPIGMLLARRAMRFYREEQERWRQERADLTDRLQQTAAAAEEQIKRLERYEADVCEERARADRYFLAIDTVVRERDRWSAAYRDAVGGHQKAQEMMMAEIKRLAARLEHAKRLVQNDQNWAHPEEARKRLAELTSAQMSGEVKAAAREFYADHGGPVARTPGQIEPAEQTIARSDPGLASQKAWVRDDPGTNEQGGVSDDPLT